MILVKKQEFFFDFHSNCESGKITYFITDKDFYLKINPNWLYWKDDINEKNYQNYEYDENDKEINYIEKEHNKFYTYNSRRITEEQYNNYTIILNDFNNLETLFNYDYKTKL
jgi:hypothetical protein